MKPAYTVAWPRPLLERMIAEFVLRAMSDGTGSNAVAAAMDEIERRLSSRPTDVGESRGANERVLIVPPLAVTFEVRDADRLVNVLRVSYRPRRPPA